MIITKIRKKLRMHPHPHQFKHCWSECRHCLKTLVVFLCVKKKKGNEKSEEMKLHDEENKNKLH